MNRQETFKVIMALKAVYNTAFGKYTTEDFEALAGAWMMCFEDYTYEQVSTGVKAYMTTNESHFPPTPAQVIKEIQALTTKQLTPNEAWALAYKAICNSGYNAQAEFDKLPPAVQKAVGSPDNLKAWATDSNFCMSVEESNFIKSYNIALERENKAAMLPSSVKDVLQIATGERIGITG